MNLVGFIFTSDEIFKNSILSYSSKWKFSNNGLTFDVTDAVTCESLLCGVLGDFIFAASNQLRQSFQRLLIFFVGKIYC